MSSNFNRPCLSGKKTREPSCGLYTIGFSDRVFSQNSGHQGSDIRFFFPGKWYRVAMHVFHVTKIRAFGLERSNYFTFPQSRLKRERSNLFTFQDPERTEESSSPPASTTNTGTRSSNRANLAAEDSAPTDPDHHSSGSPSDRSISNVSKGDLSKREP